MSCAGWGGGYGGSSGMGLLAQGAVWCGDCTWLCLAPSSTASSLSPLLPVSCSLPCWLQLYPQAPGEDGLTASAPGTELARWVLAAACQSLTSSGKVGMGQSWRRRERIGEGRTDLPRGSGDSLCSSCCWTARWLRAKLALMLPVAGFHLLSINQATDTSQAAEIPRSSNRKRSWWVLIAAAE